MEMLAGWLVCLGLWVVGWALGAPATVGLLGSLAFGSTAIASLGATTVPAFVAQAVVLIYLTVGRRNFLRDLADLVERQPLVPLVCAFVAYAVVTAILFPRLFIGETMVFIPVDGIIVEMPLGPVAGNINRSMYPFSTVGVLRRSVSC